MAESESSMLTRIVTGGVLAVFSLVSAIAMQIGYATNTEIERLAGAVTNLSKQVALIDLTVKKLPPVEWQIRIMEQESRLDRIEKELDRRPHSRGWGEDGP